MKRTLSLAICLCLVAGGAFAADTGTVARDYSGLQIAVDGPNLIQKSHGQAGFAKAAADTFYMYGGPGTDEGRMQDGILDGPPNAQGWIGVDNSEKAPIWRGSIRTPNAQSTGDGEPLGFTGVAGNAAALAQNDALVPGCDPTYTGYGDGWNMWFVFKLDLSVLDPGFDPTTDATAVQFTCEFKYDLESCCDFLEFQWNQGGAWNTLLSIAGTTYDSGTMVYSKSDFNSDDYAGGIAYAANEYIDGTNIELRIRVTSDSGWSDADGLYVSGGRGAAAIDNINVYVNSGLVSTADFEGGTAPDLPPGDFTDLNVGAVAGATIGWQPVPADFVGDFAKIFSNFEATDPCRENTTPQWTFINDGTSPSNCPTCPILPSESGTWGYGIPDGYVVNFTGGLTNGASPLDNSIWSPPFYYDPNGTVSGVTNGGALYGYTSWRHLPRPNRIYSYWAVRSQPQGGGWAAWSTSPFVYYDGDQAYGNYQHDVTEKLVQAPDSIQIALTVLDLAYIWGIEGDDATPAPTFDNVYFKKFNISGPVFNNRTIDLASDCFPVDGSLTGSCRFDANIDRDPDVLVPGDSIACEIVAIIPGTSIVHPAGGAGGLMNFSHLMNPDYGVLTDRAAAMAEVGATLVGTDPQTGWEIYEYTVVGQQVVTENGDPIEDRYYWDAPDGTSNLLPHISDENALFFGGDVVHYYMSSTDDAANTSTLPSDITGFGDFTEGNLYNRVYAVHMLPALVGGVQPNILLWNDNGHRGRENEYQQAFRQNGLIEGSDYDTYTTKGPSSGVGNGLGSAGYHGANAAQLAGYDCLIYVCGDLKSYVISDGSNTGDNDLSPDLATLTDWGNAPADRYHAYFGDHIAESMVSHGTATGTYMTGVMGVNFLGPDVRPEIDFQVSATVAPTGLSGSYVTNYVAYGGCLVINDFDWIEPLDPLEQQSAHEFLDPSGNGYVGPQISGSVEWNRLDDTETYTRHTIVFPYDLREVRGTGSPGISARATLLGEIFASWGKNPGGPAIGTNQPVAKFAMNQNYPNPFNPKTVIEFAMPARGHVSIKVYNVRGELVTTLQDGVMDSGPQRVIWSGQDSNGMQVSTGVYLYKAQYADTEVVKKMALIK